MSKVCVNGRVNPSSETKLKLFADSAGYCNRPGCNRYLFSDDDNFIYNIGEMAHIIAASEKGPRANSSLNKVEKAGYLNLILLCPSCHTEIDKAPKRFTKSKLNEWKKNHKETIMNLFRIPRFEFRREARAYIEKILIINRVIFSSFNPDLGYSWNPEAEEANVWKRKMVNQIIPNNQKILLFFEKNYHLLNDIECVTLEHFRQHVDDLIERHFGENSGISKRFPIQMELILKD